MENVDPNAVKVALERVEGNVFERFAQDFLSATLGERFVPIGGSRDGGADGVMEPQAGEARVFIQASIERNAESKITRTVARLREFGRNPVALIYVTSGVVRHIDKLEYVLSSSLQVAIRIRDGVYLRSHINDEAGTRAAFWNHLEPGVRFLRRIGSAPVLGPSRYATTPEVFVFLRQEVERRDRDEDLINSVLDALIVWALEESDPDADRFVSQERIREQIFCTIPALKEIIHPAEINNRLQAMTSKNYPGGRAVQWHPQRRGYCLPYETRVRIEEENAEDHALRMDVLEQLEKRVREVCGRQTHAKRRRAYAEHCLRALHLTFEKGGLAFAHFLERRPEDYSCTLEDAAREALVGKRLSRVSVEQAASALLEVLRGMLYASTEVERRYLLKLSRTYALLFVLNTEPRLVRYFQEMKANFELFVGTDMLVRALSERYVARASQMTRNLLQMLADAGAELLLSEPVLDEVWNHLRSSDVEFTSYFERAEDDLPLRVAGNSRRILIRAYFYAKREPERHSGQPRSWSAFMNQFCPYDSLHQRKGRQALCDYLITTFKMRWVSESTMLEVVADRQVQALTARFARLKPNEFLARNDALLALTVYGRRDQKSESRTRGEFGFRTWWLTREAAILEEAQELIAAQGGARFMMRPEFLLNFMALAPSARAVRDTYANVFPTLQGIRLANRMAEQPFLQLMQQVEEAMELEDGRREAEIALLADTLMGDFGRSYRVPLAPEEPVPPKQEEE